MSARREVMEVFPNAVIVPVWSAAGACFEVRAESDECALSLGYGATRETAWKHAAVTAEELLQEANP